MESYYVFTSFQKNINLRPYRPDLAATNTPENNDLVGWMRKYNRAARTLEQFFYLVCQITWNFHNLRFNDNEDTTLNLSFSIFTSTALLPVHLQPALSTIKDAMKKQWITKYSPFPKCLFLRDVFVAVVASEAFLILVFKLSYSLFISFQEKIIGKSVAQIWPCSFSLRYYLHFKYHSYQIVANQIRPKERLLLVCNLAARAGNFWRQNSQHLRS